MRAYLRFLVTVGLVACGGEEQPETAGAASGGRGNTGVGAGGGPPVAGAGGSGVPLGGASGMGGSQPGTGGQVGTAGQPGAGGVAGTDGGPPPGVPGTVVPEPADEAAFLWDPAVVRTYNIVIAPQDLEAIDAQPAAEAWAPASLEFEGQTYGPLMVRYKGSAGAFLRPCTSSQIPGFSTGRKTGKCSMKIGFDQVDPAGRFFGLRKVNLHAMNNDRSLLRERIGYGLFRQFGIAAPRAMHARVLINGQLEGLFAMVEQIDGRFTRSRFTEGGEGNLYKEIWPLHDSADAYLAALESNRSQNPSAQRMLDFKAAIAEGSVGVDRFLEREYTMRYVAADRVMINDDGAFHFWCTALGQGNNPGGVGNHNYYWYEEATSGRIWIVPWDMDSSLDATQFVRVSPEWRTPAACLCQGGSFATQMPPSCDPLVAVWGSQNAEYERYVDEFLAGPFAEARVDASIAAHMDQIRPWVVEAAGRGGAPTEAQWDEAVNFLRLALLGARNNRGAAY